MPATPTVTRLATLSPCLALLAGLGAGLPASLNAMEVDIHGAVSQGYMLSTKNDYLGKNTTNGDFSLNEITLNVASQVSDSLRVGVQLFSRNMGPLADNEVTIDWAYGDYTLPVLDQRFGLRVGKVKLPLGLNNDIQDIDQIRPFVLMPQAVYNTVDRDFILGIWGAQVYGTSHLGAAGDLDLAFTVGQFDLGQGAVARFENGSPFAIQGSIDSDISYSASVFWRTPVQGLRFGLSGVLTENITATGAGVIDFGMGPMAAQSNYEIDWYLRWKASVEYMIGDWIFAAEYRRDRFDFQTEITAGGMTIQDSRSIPTSDGFYVSAVWRFHPDFEAGAYFSWDFADVDDRSGSDRSGNSFEAYQRDIALALRWDITPSFTWKVEGHFIQGTSLLMTQTSPDVDDRSKSWTFFATKATFSF